MFAESIQQASLGARVLAALVPASYPDLNALHRASGIAYSTLHAWKKGTANPRWEQIERLAELVGRDPFDLVGAAAWAPPWFVRLAIPLGMSWREAV